MGSSLEYRYNESGLLKIKTYSRNVKCGLINKKTGKKNMVRIIFKESNCCIICELYVEVKHDYKILIQLICK